MNESNHQSGERASKATEFLRIIIHEKRKHNTQHMIHDQDNWLFLPQLVTSDQPTPHHDIKREIILFVDRQCYVGRYFILPWIRCL